MGCFGHTIQDVNSYEFAWGKADEVERCAVQCSEDYADLYLGTTSQVHGSARMGASPVGQDSAVHLHLKNKSYSVEDCKAYTEREVGLRGVRRCIYNKWKKHLKTKMVAFSINKMKIYLCKTKQ